MCALCHRNRPRRNSLFLPIHWPLFVPNRLPLRRAPRAGARGEQALAYSLCIRWGSTRCVSHPVMSDSAIPWTVAHQTPLFKEFSRQEYWRGLPFPSPGDLSDPGIKLVLLHCRWILYHLSHQGGLEVQLSSVLETFQPFFSNSQKSSPLKVWEDFKTLHIFCTAKVLFFKLKDS